MTDLGFGVTPLGNIFQQHDRAAVGHRLEGPGQRPISGEVGIGGNDAPRLRVLDFSEDYLAARRRDRSGADTGGDDVGSARAALHETVGQLHHFAETIVHHRKPAVGAEHAQTMRHVVQRGIELISQRRLALARHVCSNENPLQVGRDLLQRQKKHRADDRHSDVIGGATKRQRNRRRTAGECNLHVEYPRPSIGPARTAAT